MAAYLRIADLKYLRSFTFGRVMVHQELFQALGQLPHLEILSLRADKSQGQGDCRDPISVPGDSFPSLRHLELHFLNEPALSRICNIPPLFRHLVSAAIIFEGRPNRSDATITSRLNCSELSFACLGANSPRLERITVLTEGDVESPLEISWSIINALKLMPLWYLRVGTIKLGANSNSGTKSELTWRHLLAATPHLEELHMGNKMLWPEELQLLGSWLPKLRLLVFWQVDFRKTRQPTKFINATQPIIIRCWSYFGSTPRVIQGIRWVPCIPEEPDVWNAARYIHGIWPNATCELDPVGSWPNRSPPNEQTGKKLNEAIALLKHRTGRA